MADHRADVIVIDTSIMPARCLTAIVDSTVDMATAPERSETTSRRGSGETRRWSVLLLHEPAVDARGVGFMDKLPQYGS